MLLMNGRLEFELISSTELGASVSAIFLVFYSGLCMSRPSISVLASGEGYLDYSSLIFAFCIQQCNCTVPLHVYLMYQIS